MPIHRISLRFVSVVFLSILILVGVFYRFYNLNWNQEANLHPDEYGLTNTLTQLSLPDSLSDYFNTRLSTISPYMKYDETGQAVADGPDNSLRWGQWPIIVLRDAAELTGNTGYDELRLMGRAFVASLDVLTISLIFLIGSLLYGWLTGLLGAALCSLAVLQIQQSHFMTVDNFAVFFATLTMFAAVRIAGQAPVERQAEGRAVYQITWRSAWWYMVFGVSFGMALASKINLLPLGGMVLVAVFLSIADLKLRYRQDLPKIFLAAGVFLALAGVTALVTFRICQPMSFRAASGDTSFWTLHLNPDWLANMQAAQQESNGIDGGPPAEQWTDRTAIVFPLINMVMWGMGLPLGIASWAGFAGACWQALRGQRNWRLHLLPLVWTGGYFLFMATRWVKSIRYFLPIYPFLCLLAAWGLMEVFHWTRSAEGWSITWRKIGRAVALVLAGLVIGGTFVWATAFVKAVYGQDHTRIQATEWILQYIPAPIHLQITSGGWASYVPISVPDGYELSGGTPLLQSFTAETSGRLTSVLLPHVSFIGKGEMPMTLTLSSDAYGTQILDQTTLMIPASSNERGVEVQGVFQGAEIEAGETYYVSVTSPTERTVRIFRNILANEEWDEGVPVAYDGIDPFSLYYAGVTMNVRWTDDENKREMFSATIAQADYIILPSQRAIWSACRLALMYPMTLEYYRALFNGDLGFDLVAAYQAPIQIGALWISDVGGTVAWGEDPELPLFNFNALAAEEAFSVYDHPPVWVFQKGEDFSMEQVDAVLGAVDLSKVQIQTPRYTKVGVIE